MDGQKYVATLANLLNEGSAKSDRLGLSEADIMNLGESTLDVVSDLEVGKKSIFVDTR